MDPIIKKTDTTLETIRVFDAPIAELYHAWIEPEVMNKWYYPTDQYRSSCSVDLRVGGSYEVHRQRPDDDFWAIVVYQAIEPEEKLVFTWSFVDSDEPEALITVLFCPLTTPPPSLRSCTSVCPVLNGLMVAAEVGHLVSTN